jgi:hypothetical protein
MPHFGQPQSRLAPKFLAATPRGSRHRRDEDKFRHGTETTIKISSVSKRGAPEQRDIYLLHSETDHRSIHKHCPTAFAKPLCRAFVGRGVGGDSSEAPDASVGCARKLQLQSLPSPPRRRLRTLRIGPILRRKCCEALLSISPSSLFFLFVASAQSGAHRLQSYPTCRQPI